MIRISEGKDNRVSYALLLLAMAITYGLGAPPAAGQCPPGLITDEFCPPTLVAPPDGVAYNHYNIVLNWTRI